VTSPVVIVSRDDTRDPLTIEWFEDENCFYCEDPLAVVEFDPWRDVWTAWAKKNARTETRLLAARTLLALVLDAGENVRKLATHYVPELGAPLEPVRGSAA
jgi:hypothetical protein